MKSLHLLSLLHIISSQAVISSPTTTHTNGSICYLDPFYHLRPSPLPACSLSPASSSEATPELLTFEEWKRARQVASDSLQKPLGNADNASHYRHKVSGDMDDVGSERSSASADGTLPTGGEDAGHNNLVQDASNAHFRVPLTDRFNFAAQDCTARIHSAQKGAKSTSAILSSKKDRYMLSPCASKEKFVVVELCDDVRIDTVQLANLEFFSGVFKDIRISLAETSPGDTQGWIDAGVYRAKNVRGVQSFHPPAGRQKFYRYIRVDFLSHYGNEYYCPVSLLRVYGLTHMEDYKWAGWQTGHEAAMDVQVIKTEEAMPVTEDGTLPITDVPPASSTGKTEVVASPPPETAESSVVPGKASVSTATESPTPKNAMPTEAPPPLMLSEPHTDQAPPREYPVVPSVSSEHHSPEISNESAPEPVLADTVEKEKPTTAASSSSSSSTSQPSTTPTAVLASSNGTSEISAAPSKEHSARQVNSSATIPTPSSAPLITNGGESIYRTIMNRLHMLETNSTLGVSYVEEQTRSVRQVVRKLEEDLGRLDAFGKTQQRLFTREMEKQRKDREAEMHKLMTDIQTLTREVALEKRLGFLQLCLLICAFIFMGYTRGSREQTFIGQASAEGLRTIESWRSGDWNRWRMRRASGDLSRTAPSRLSHRKGSLMGKNPSSDPFGSPAIAGPSTSPSVNPSQSQAHSQREPFAPGFRLPRPRQRVTSSPSLPLARTSRPSPRRVAAHLHEVKQPPEPSKRRHPIDIIEGDVEVEAEVEMEGTPRARRTMSPSNHSHSPMVRLFPLGPAYSEKQKELADHRGRQDEREVSPASTVEGGELSEDSALWEDTSTEGGDEFPDREEDEVGDAPGVSETDVLLSAALQVSCEVGASQETLRVGSS